MSTHKDNSRDLVKQNDILKAQVALEDKARVDWHRKWGFLLDFDKFVLEEAAKQRISEKEYRRWTFKRKNKNFSEHFHGLHFADSVPKTSTGFVGWRSRPEDNLELFGPLYESPLHTLPPKEQNHSLFLH